MGDDCQQRYESVEHGQKEEIVKKRDGNLKAAQQQRENQRNESETHSQPDSKRIHQVNVVDQRGESVAH